MSGLVGFFKDFLPNVQNIDYNRRWEDLTEDEKRGGAVRQGGASTNTTTDTTTNSIHTDPLREALSRPVQLVEFTPEALSFKEFRKFNRESLKAYYYRRLIREAEEDDDEPNEDQDQDQEEDWESDVEKDVAEADQAEAAEQDDDDDDDENTEMALESQPVMPPPPSETNKASADTTTTAATGASRQRRRQWRIPPLYQAIHSIRTLDYLDLRTKDLSLDLCRVTKIWRLRETKRGTHYLRTSHSSGRDYKQRCGIFPGRMPRLVFGNLEDDGPLSSTYDYVLSLEVEQLVPSPKLKATLKKRSIRIFLYNAYAKAVSEWMEEQSISARSGSSSKYARSNNNNSNYILSLFQIPAISVFPRALDPRDWWDQEHMLNYCICLGGASSMATTREQTTTPLRADSPDLELRLALTTTTTTTLLSVDQEDTAGAASDELLVSPAILSGPAEEGPEEDILLPRSNRLLKTWREYYQAQNPAPVHPSRARIPGPPPPQPPPEQQQQQQQDQKEMGPSQAAQEIKKTTQAPRSNSTAPAIPNFSTRTAAAPANTTKSNQQQQQQRGSRPETTASSEPPTVRVPPNRPPPPPLVERPCLGEPMIFEGTARRRSHITDVTNIPNHTGAAAPTNNYVSLASLKTLYDSYRKNNTTGARGGGFNNNQYMRIDTYGVVMGFTAPSQTKRGDWMVNANLVDETCTVPITLVIFTKNITNLPHFQKTGDVLRLHRVGLSEWNGEAQLTGQAVSSYVVIRRKTDNTNGGDAAAGGAAAPVSSNPTAADTAASSSSTPSWIVAPTATKEYSFEEFDKQRSQNLWHWGQQLFKDQPTMLTKHKFTLGEMAQLSDEDGERIKDRDLTVMITGLIPYPRENQLSTMPCGFLRVWDGTGERPSDFSLPMNDPLPINTLAANATQSDGVDPSRESVAKLAAVVARWNAEVANTVVIRETVGNTFESFTMPQLQVPESICGKVANVIIWERAHWDLICNHVPVGTFIRLRNVDVRKWNTHNFRSFMVHSKSWLSPLPDLTYEIRILLEEHDGRMKRNDYNPHAAVLPSSNNTAQPVVPAARAPAINPYRNETNTAAPPAEPITANAPKATLRLGNGLEAFSSSDPLQDDTRPRKKRKKKHSNFTTGPVYKGVVRLLAQTHPPFNGDLGVYLDKSAATPTYKSFFLNVVDESKTPTSVAVGPTTAEKLFGVPAADVVQQGGHHRREAPFDSTEAWNATIQLFLADSKKFFHLKDIEKVVEEGSA